MKICKYNKEQVNLLASMLFKIHFLLFLATCFTCTVCTNTFYDLNKSCTCVIDLSALFAKKRSLKKYIEHCSKQFSMIIEKRCKTSQQ